MKSVEKFTVEIRSGFDQWWRYNAALMCGAFDASGNRIGFASAESRVAEMGSNLEAPPEGLDLHRSLTLETVPCERIVLYIYVIIRCPATTKSGDILRSRCRCGFAMATGPCSIRSIPSTSGEGRRSSSRCRGRDAGLRP